MGDRAWFALQCLPRDDRGQPPKVRQLELDHGLSNGAIHKIIWGVTTAPTFPVLRRVAQALGTTPEWLLDGEGEGPRASFPVVPRPEPPKGAASRQHKRSRSRPHDGIPATAQKRFEIEAKQLSDRPKRLRTGSAGE